MILVKKFFIYSSLILAAIIVNVFLFSIFPILHNLLTEKITIQEKNKSSPKVILEYKKPERKKEELKAKLIKSITSSSQKKTITSELQLKFTPDLSVEGSGEIAMEEQELSAEIFEEGETDEPAIPLYQPPIPYPERARELEIEGVFEAIILIDTDGKVSSIDIIKSPHQSISSEAKKVISTWRFKPAKNKGVPVKIRVRQVVEFSLE
ncbi:MAG: energy transducer TonB [Chitinispirillaceae bacterium]|nr:energy transducer TonB [Chitinispirillaceae bacterium]